ncbi:MAG: 50S ribosomal protein L21 [Anaerolineales bacterium]
MRYAVWTAGGRQYLAVEGQALEVDKLANAEGDRVEFREVLLVAEDDRVQVGTPTIEGAIVHGRVLAHLRGPKIRVFKYAPKKRTRKRQGHRQDLTRVQIDRIGYPGAEDRPAEKEKAAAEERPAKARRPAPRPGKAAGARPGRSTTRPAEAKLPARAKKAPGRAKRPARR